MSISDIIDAAMGRIQCDLLIKNGKVLNFFTGKIEKCNIAILKDTIVGLGDYSAKETIDAEECYISAGFIDAHVHIESSLVSVFEYSKAVVKRGTTSIIADPHEIANVLGLDGIRFILYSAKYSPINVFLTAPSCVPATQFETSGSTLRAFDINPLFSEKWVLGLAEMMNFPGVINKDPIVLDKISIASGKIIDGHCPDLTDKELNAYIATGIYSDHETTRPEEALEKMSKGMFIMIREGTSTKDLAALIPIINDFNHSRIMFCTDDRHPHDLINEGHIDNMVKRTIRAGINPVTAYKIASFTAARYFGLKDLGAIAPGYKADLVIVDDLENVTVNKVIKNGKLIVNKNTFLYEPPVKLTTELRGTVNIKWLSEDDFKIKAEPGKKVRIMKILPGQIITEEIIDTPKTDAGFIVPDTDRDHLLVAVVERHRASDNIGLGLVNGFNLKKGAIASSVSHDSHNIIAMGTNVSDILRAIIRIKGGQGGFSIAVDDKIIGNLVLPIAGLMSEQTIEEVDKQMQDLLRKTKELGCSIEDPFMQMGFLALPVIPKLKITDKGLFDVDKFDFVDLFVEE